MRYRQMIFSVSIALLLLSPLTAHSDDADDLKASVEQVVLAIQNRDLDGIAASTHDNWIGYVGPTPFPVDGKAAQRQMWQGIFANTERFALTPINRKYRVTGTTGVVIGYTRIGVKPKDGPARTVFVRHMSIWAKEDGKWLAVATHTSRIPSGN